MRLAFALLALSAAPALAAPFPVADDQVYTLYRDSVFSDISPIHVATFDSRDGREYNRANCAIARNLFQQQPGVTVNYWCQPGRDPD